MSRRAFVVVLDACGVGALPDAAEYGDAGTNTLGHLAEVVDGLSLPTLERLGLGSIVPLRGVAPSRSPVVHGRLHALGPGKDSTAGHWELMGVVASVPAPTYPDGFPPEVVERVRAAAGRDTIGHLPSEGLAALHRWGPEHLGDGALIVYTSADSVLQIAAHADVVGVDDLYAACARVREVTDVGRVIARPFTGRPGAFERLPARRDFALAPPSRSYLDAVGACGLPVHAVGKVGQLFAGVGVDHDHAAPDNATAIAATSALLADLDTGLVFTNLVETDTVFGPPQGRRGVRRGAAAHRRRGGGLARAPARGRSARADGRPRLRHHARELGPHPRARAAAGGLRGLRRASPRRPAGRRGSVRAALAGGPRRSRFARVIVRMKTQPSTTLKGVRPLDAPTLNHPQGGQTP
jgi:phosphopentomutase